MNSLGFNKLEKDTKVVVAMSGGVDSSVVACQLKEQGYDVIGITLQLYDIGDALKKKNACCAGVDIEDAKKVAAKFNFPHYVLNYENLFKESVIDDFADSYLAGETPIPCVKCNQSVKFRDLLKVAKDLGANCLATGHYIQRKVSNKGEAELHKAIDLSKDQSYFLFATTKEQLDFLRFPLGANEKEFTRKEAERFGLEIFNKPDSQDICFVPSGNYAQVVRKHRPSAFKDGPIIDILSNKVLGSHQGIINFTLGQRRGLGISSSDPLYVVKIDPKQNIVYVGPQECLQNQEFKIRDINWLASDIDRSAIIDSKVKLRSTSDEQTARIEFIDDFSARVIMKSNARAVTPGQACVIYQDSRILGGGWITREIS